MKRVLLLFVCLIVLSPLTAKGGDPDGRYGGYMELAFGDAYNFNTAQLISTNNMQLYCAITTTHGYEMNNWFVGGGIGCYHSFRDNENMYPIYSAGRYTFKNVKVKPYIEAHAGIVYDPLWVETIQAYGALSAGISVFNRLQVGLRGSMFSRPSRYFTANAAVVINYEFGK